MLSLQGSLFLFKPNKIYRPVVFNDGSVIYKFHMQRRFHKVRSVYLLYHVQATLVLLYEYTSIDYQSYLESEEVSYY